jgi:hypothetical protein
VVLAKTITLVVFDSLNKLIFCNLVTWNEYDISLFYTDSLNSISGTAQDAD